MKLLPRVLLILGGVALGGAIGVLSYGGFETWKQYIALSANRSMAFMNPVGYMIGGAVVLEVIFSLPGMGMAILSGVTSNYVMLVQGVVLVVAITFIIVNVIVDMLYILIDPRIRTV